MISLHRILIVLLLAGAFACQSDNNNTQPTVQEQATELLLGTWKAQDIVSSPVPGSEGALNELRLTFGNLNEPSAFTASGAPRFFTTNTASQWQWATSDSADEILLIDVQGINQLAINSLTANVLILSFQIDQLSTGKVEGIGNYEVEFSKEP